jgi:hypothetical protein
MEGGREGGRKEGRKEGKPGNKEKLSVHVSNYYKTNMD